MDRQGEIPRGIGRVGTITQAATPAAQTRYAVGTREILESHFAGAPIRDEYLIVDGGKLSGAGAHSYSTSG